MFHMIDLNTIPQCNHFGELIHCLFDQQRIVKADHSEKLSEIIKLSVAQCYKKLNNTSGWNREQMEAVAGYFGVSVDKLQRKIGKIYDAVDGSFSIADADAAQEVTGTLEIGGAEYECKARIGMTLPSAHGVQFIAVKRDDAWRVMPADKAPDTFIHMVYGLEIIIREKSAYSVAVLDDDPNTANSLAEFLEAEGYAAKPFYDLESLAAAIPESNFDAYVLDWLIGEHTSADLIKRIKLEHSPSSVVILLTGQMEINTTQSDLLPVISTFGLNWREKPTRPAFIAIDLKRDLAIRRANAKA